MVVSFGPLLGYRSGGGLRELDASIVKETTERCDLTVPRKTKKERMKKREKKKETKGESERKREKQKDTKGVKQI